MYKYLYINKIVDLMHSKSNVNKFNAGPNEYSWCYFGVNANEWPRHL